MCIVFTVDEFSHSLKLYGLVGFLWFVCLQVYINVKVEITQS